MIGKQKCDNVMLVQKNEDRNNPEREKLAGFSFTLQSEDPQEGA